MPRPLSSAEYAAFTSAYPQYNPLDPSFAMQPTQAAVVNWNSEIILVYVGTTTNTLASTDTTTDSTTATDNSILNYFGIDTSGLTTIPDVYYSDVTDSTQAIAIQQPGYTDTPSWWGTFLTTLPQNTINVIVQDAEAAGALIDKAGNALPGAITSGLMIIAGLLVLVIMAKS